MLHSNVSGYNTPTAYPPSNTHAIRHPFAATVSQLRCRIFVEKFSTMPSKSKRRALSIIISIHLYMCSFFCFCFFLQYQRQLTFSFTTIRLLLLLLYFSLRLWPTLPTHVAVPQYRRLKRTKVLAHFDAAVRVSSQHNHTYDGSTIVSKTAIQYLLDQRLPSWLSFVSVAGFCTAEHITHHVVDLIPPQSKARTVCSSQCSRILTFEKSSDYARRPASSSWDDDCSKSSPLQL